jgi:iron complex outermembrane receptor protein
VTANTTFTPNVLEDLAGNPLPNSPRTQADISLEYYSDFENFEIKSRVQYAYTDERWFNEFQEDISYQSSTTVLNANVLFRFENSDWSLNIWGRNLTDETILSHVNVTSSTIGHALLATLMPPRTYGLTASYEF